MSSVLRVGFDNGEVEFRKGVDAVPATTKKEGNVTTHNAAIPGVPAHYYVTFRFHVECEATGGLTYANIFHWSCIVPEANDKAPYREIEAQASRQLAPMLRAAAEKIEEAVAEFDRLEKEKSETP